MKKNKIALLGGQPIQVKPLKPYNTISSLEIKKANDVLNSGQLSGYIAAPGENFLGGKWTKKLEEDFCRKFEVKYSITVNSATSALHAALIAAGVGEDDEVITSPYTMAASATTAVMCGAKPIFVDIEPDYFCLDVEKVKKAISSKTKVIMAVNIFGQAANLKKLRKVADEKNIILIEDNAQAPGAKFDNIFTGTIGHMGIFSLNRHKTIQTGEGGVIVTNSQCLANRCRLVRNHGEAVIPETSEFNGHEDIIGYNYRLTELQSAIAIPQLKRLDKLNERRQELASFLFEEISKFDFLEPPKIRNKCTHVYYLFPMKYDSSVLKVSRDKFVEALNAEGFPVANYVRPLMEIPLFKRKFGNTENLDLQNYPITKNLWEDSMIITSICRPPLNISDMKNFVKAVDKIANSANLLRNL